MGGIFRFRIWRLGYLKIFGGLQQYHVEFYEGSQSEDFKKLWGPCIPKLKKSVFGHKDLIAFSNLLRLKGF